MDMSENSKPQTGRSSGQKPMSSSRRDPEYSDVTLPDENPESHVRGKPRRSLFKTFEPSSQRFITQQGNDETGTQSQTTLVDQDAPESQDATGSNFSRFKFINSGEGSPKEAGSVVRAHVMRNYHREKGNSDLQKAPKLGRTKRQDLGQLRPLAPSEQSSSSPTSSSSPVTIWTETLPTQNYSSSSASASDDGGHEEIHDGWVGVIGRHSPGTNAVKLQSSFHREHFAPAIQYPLWQMTTSTGLRIGRQDGELIHHCIKFFVKSWIPMNAQSESDWYTNALSDDACYHVSLFVSGAHRAVMAGSLNNLPLECYCHKGKAIEIINRRLSDPEKCFQDSTIATIACLAAYENVFGSLAVASYHVNGLELLLNLRGGLNGTEMHGFLTQLVQWADLCNATGVMQKARFQPLNVTEVLEPELLGPNDLKPNTLSNKLWRFEASQVRDVQETYFKGMSVTMANTFHRTQLISAMLAGDLSVRDNAEAQLAYIEKVLLLERRVNAVVHYGEKRPGFSLETGSSSSIPCRSFNIAILVYIYVVLREIPVNSPIIDKLVTRLRASLAFMDTFLVFEKVPARFLLWMLIIGGWASEGRPEHSWIGEATQFVRSFLGLDSWAEAKAVLMQHAWVDRICDGPCEKFWVELNTRNTATTSFCVKLE